jgi:hypothetical protein
VAVSGSEGSFRNRNTLMDQVNFPALTFMAPVVHAQPTLTVVATPVITETDTQ